MTSLVAPFRCTRGILLCDSFVGSIFRAVFIPQSVISHSVHVTDRASSRDEITRANGCPQHKSHNTELVLQYSS